MGADIIQTPGRPVQEIVSGSPTRNPDAVAGLTAVFASIVAPVLTVNLAAIPLALAIPAVVHDRTGRENQTRPDGHE